MRSGQGESRACVVKGCRCPCCRGVTCLASNRELSGHVTGIFRGLIDRLMARVALKRSIPEDAVLVARDAGNGSVASRQGKSSTGVIEA